ncbi:hypothetical protein D3C78_1428980 [compost metagenome]
MLRRQVADDAVGLPEHEAIVLDHRHQAVGVLRPVGRFVDHAERATGIDRFIGHTGLFRAPQRLAHVGRILPAPDLQHAMQSFRWLIGRRQAPMGVDSGLDHPTGDGTRKKAVHIDDDYRPPSCNAAPPIVKARRRREPSKLDGLS